MPVLFVLEEYVFPSISYVAVEHHGESCLIAESRVCMSKEAPRPGAPVEPAFAHMHQCRDAAVFRSSAAEKIPQPPHISREGCRARRSDARAAIILIAQNLSPFKSFGVRRFTVPQVTTSFRLALLTRLEH
jgi:hypothetical protein